MSLKNVVESKFFEKFIVFIIVANAITLGLETRTDLTHSTITLLTTLDKIFLLIFTIELLLKFLLYKSKFFNDPWRIFDLIVVSVSLLPSTGPFSVIRSLRILRTLRMISVVPSLKKVVAGLLTAIPGLGAVAAIMMLIYYVAAVMATKLFMAEFPEWFGTIGKSAYTLFQIMTLESWSMGIVRPVMEKFPYAWIFFVPYILIATFIMLNLFIAVIVNAMQAETESAAEGRAQTIQDDLNLLVNEIKELRLEIKKLKN